MYLFWHTEYILKFNITELQNSDPLLSDTKLQLSNFAENLATRGERLELLINKTESLNTSVRLTSFTLIAHSNKSFNRSYK